MIGDVDPAGPAVWLVRGFENSIEGFLSMIRPIFIFIFIFQFKNLGQFVIVFLSYFFIFSKQKQWKPV